MSLVDTDKSKPDRSAPSPNHTDRLNDGSIKSHATVSTHYNAGADTNPGFLQQRNKQIIANTGTSPIALYGYNTALSQWGLFVTKTGVDVTTNTDPSKFIFNSGQDIFKIAQKTAVINSTGFNFTVPAGQVVVVTQFDGFAHSLGIIPQIVGSTIAGGGTSYNALPLTTTNAPTTTTILTTYLSTTATSNSVDTIVTVVGDARGSTGGLNVTVPSFPFTLYLLQETAN